MKKVYLDNQEYYLEENPEDESIYGTITPDFEPKSLEKTQEIKVINEEELLENTLTDIWGENNG